MSEEKYTKRDYLAQLRTHLADERTLLAYWRTSFALFILGVFLIKFIDSIYCIWGSILSFIFGITLFIYGTIRFYIQKERINKILSK